MFRFLTIAFLFVTLPIAGQQPRYRADIEVKLIEIDVVVTDRDGNHVPGLTVDDFELFEGRRRRDITNFTEYRSVTADPSEGVASAPAAAVRNVPEPRTVVVLLDVLPRSGFVRSTVFEKLEPALAKIVRDGDRASVVFWDPGLDRPRTLVEMSTDADEVLAAVRRLSQHQVAADPAALAEADADRQEDFFKEAAAIAAESGATYDALGNTESAQRFTAESTLMRLRRKTRMMRRIITSLGGTRGRKAVLYVSNDLPIPGEAGAKLSALGMLDELARDANAAGVTFYAVRPNVPMPDFGDASAADAVDEPGGAMGAFQVQLDALARVAEATGGTVDFGLPAVEKLSTRMAADLNSYYSLAYRAESDGRDRERRISVRVKNPEYQVRTRKAYVDKSDETIARDTLLAKLFGGAEVDGLSFEVIEGKPRRTGRNRWILPVTLKIPTDQLRFAAEAKTQTARVKVLIIAVNGLAELTNVADDDLRIVQGRDTRAGFITYSVEIVADNRGSELSIGVFDQRSGLAGVRTIDNRDRMRSDRGE